MATDNTTSGLLRDEHAELLDVTDQLRSLGLGNHMPLPQLVVCGDQSCGKSSVLESISGVKFPVSDGLCTRFAIQLVLRRSSWRQTSVTIEPGRSSSEEQKQRFNEFNAANEGYEDLSKVIERAKSIMGLDENGTFSDALLRIESSGPDPPHLTLVDLPGLIHCPDLSQTDKDVETVERLVQDYMVQERTIILAVMSANNQAGLQKILKLAKGADPTRCRTMGIITKPDTLPFGSEMEKKYLRYARNEEEPLGLGWHVVRNANFEECRDVSYDRRSKEHELFSTNPWKGLPTTSLGAEALVTRLSKCSFDLTRSELPKVVQDIQSHIADCRNQLQRLGTPRLTVGEQRLYLSTTAQTFQQVVRDGVEGQFGSNDFFNDHSLRLRAEYRRITDAFADAMRNDGRTYEPPQSEYGNYLNLINDQILKVNRGVELPTTFDPRLVRQVFKRQSINWESIALRYADDVFFTAKRFVEELLKVNTEDATYDKLREELIEPAMSLKQSLLHDKVRELLTPYTRRHPFSTNPIFIQELKQIGLNPKQHPEGKDTDLAAAMYACRNLAEWEKAYYRTALNTFVDNMATLAVENCVLADLDQIFSHSKIATMDDETLERLASESAETIAMRKSVEHNLDVFEQSLRICRRCGFVTSALARGDSVDQPSARARMMFTESQQPGVDVMAGMLSRANMTTPEIQLTNVAQTEVNISARRESGASVVSSPSASGRAGRSTRTPSLVHSPGPSPSPSPARSSSSISSPGSVLNSRYRNAKEAEVTAESEEEMLRRQSNLGSSEIEIVNQVLLDFSNALSDRGWLVGDGDQYIRRYVAVRAWL